jgi:hypothetical protein
MTQDYVHPSGSSGSSSAVTHVSPTTSAQERHTKALLVMLMVIIGLSLGIYVGKGEV